MMFDLDSVMAATPDLLQLPCGVPLSSHSGSIKGQKVNGLHLIPVTWYFQFNIRLIFFFFEHNTNSERHYWGKDVSWIFQILQNIWLQKVSSCLWTVYFFTVIFLPEPFYSSLSSILDCCSEKQKQNKTKKKLKKKNHHHSNKKRTAEIFKWKCWEKKNKPSVFSAGFLKKHDTSDTRIVYISIFQHFQFYSWTGM